MLMTQISIRLKNHKKAITPVIATIILIAVTLVLALVVGAYAFGLFGSNVKTVTLTSGNLFAGYLNPVSSVTAGSGCESAQGESYISMALNNPGAQTTVSSFTLTGSSISGVTVTVSYDSAVGVSCTGVSALAPTLAAGKVSPLTLYFFASGTNGGIVSGQTYNYVINLGNGQSVSGSLIAQ